MDNKQIERIKQILMKEKKEVMREIKSITDNLEISEQESTGELSQYDNHSGDSGTNMFEREKDLGLKDNEQTILNQIEEALDKIEKGTYGYCSRCKCEINPERLEALPYATLCIECQRKVEAKDDRVLRPIEEEVLKNPFSRSFSDSEDKTGFDGEDTWQAVARYEKLPHISEYLCFENGDGGDLGYVEPVEKISNKQYRNQLE